MVAMNGLVVLGYVVVEVHRVQDLDDVTSASWQLRRRMEVGEGDLVVKPAISEEGEKSLERDRIIAKVQSAVREVNPQQLQHEALALELAVMLPLLARPPLCEPDELREILRMGLLPASDEVQVPSHTGAKLGSIILAHEAADVVGFAFVQDRNDINIEPRAREPDVDAVGGGDDLVLTHGRVRRGHQVADPVDKRGDFFRRLLGLHVDGKVPVVGISQGRALGYGTGMQCLDEAVARSQRDLVLDPIAKPVDLSPLVIDLGFLQIDLVVREQHEVTVRNLRHLKLPLPVDASDASFLLRFNMAKIYLARAPWMAGQSVPPSTLTCSYANAFTCTDDASAATLLTFSCSRWWSRSLRRRSSCRLGAS